jgi:Fe-S oxidoreductase
VLLFPDTFNEFFHPTVADAAVEVLEHAGCDIVLPAAPLCCGRPLYDYGLLDQAKRRLRRALSVLKDEIARGTPMLVLEPSCAAVFRDELVNLYPHDEDARRLSRQTFTLPELLDRLPDYAPPHFAGSPPQRALVQTHCHQHALLQPEMEELWLKKMDAAPKNADAGCCGMAGSFGFESRHDRVSMAVGERKLLPEVRRAPADTIIVADGFCCREQIRQATPRRGLHLAQVLLMAERGQAVGRHPERDFPQPAASRGLYTGVFAVLAVAAALWGLRRAILPR